jgi:RHS repeat-associated protein
VFNPWRYTGQYQDTTTGLYKMGARYYQPELGRWTQQDPSGLDANAYLYVSGNPVNFVDPSGLAFLGIDYPFGETDSGGCNGASRSVLATGATGIFAGSVAAAACIASGGVGCPAAIGAAAGTTKFVSEVTQGSEPGEAIGGAACVGVAAGISATGIGAIPGAVLGAQCQ